MLPQGFVDTADAEPYVAVVDGVERLWLMIPKGSPDPELKTGWNPILGQTYVKALQFGKMIGMTTF